MADLAGPDASMVLCRPGGFYFWPSDSPQQAPFVRSKCRFANTRDRNTTTFRFQPIIAAEIDKLAGIFIEPETANR